MTSTGTSSATPIPAETDAPQPLLTSLTAGFIAPTTDGTPQAIRPRRRPGQRVTLKELLEAPFNAAFDYLHARARRYTEVDETEVGLLAARELSALLTESGLESRAALDLQAALLSVVTAFHIERNTLDEALVTGAAALGILAREPKRKDEPFLQLLGTLLFDLARIHSSRGELRQAEREIEKSARVFQKLAATAPERYGSAHIATMDACAGIYRSVKRQTQMLEECKEATVSYMELVRQREKGHDSSALRAATQGLITSLAAQGTTLLQMDKPRQAVPFLTRALKMLTRLEPELTPRGLDLSIALGEALVAVPATRDKGVHLLNTMLHKASRLGAAAEHRRIVEILLNVKTDRLSVLSVWHKIFPK